MGNALELALSSRSIWNKYEVYERNSLFCLSQLKEKPAPAQLSLLLLISLSNHAG